MNECDHCEPRLSLRDCKTPMFADLSKEEMEEALDAVFESGELDQVLAAIMEECFDIKQQESQS